jgi:hypothetical protein
VIQPPIPHLNECVKRVVGVRGEGGWGWGPLASLSGS